MQIPFLEKIKSIPEFFGMRVNEQPNYICLKSYEDVEVRQYPELLMASVTLSGLTYDTFRKNAFTKLAEYIFDKDPVSGEYIPMTAPVLTENVGGDAWKMSFILPKKYDLLNVRRPIDPAIVVSECEPMEVIAYTYTGNNSVSNIHRHASMFTHWLKNHTEYKTEDSMILAQYDAPFVIPTVKKNEIWFRLTKEH